jgi:phosphoglycolate phosphatase-like HAD superfamily hydrolase
MRPISDFDIYIFDCDGVVLDSNQLKIDAMAMVLSELFTNKSEIDDCINYFKHNFGKSRFHHVDIFLSKYLNVLDQDAVHYRKSILSSYSSMCKQLYLEAEVTPGFLEFVGKLNGKKFIASGSEQEELRYVFKQRGLNNLFDGIYGSPTAKSENINTIIKEEHNSNAIMFGDALSDLNAAIDNSIDFIAYLPFSNVAQKLKLLSIEQGFSFHNSWSEIN